MSTAPLPDALRLLAPRLTEALGAAIVAIQALIAHHFLRHPVFQPVINPLWQRLNRARHCLTRLAARIEAGRPLPASRAGRTRLPRPVTLPDRPHSPIPQTRGWLLKALAWHVAVHRNRLERLLAEPGMADLVAATPALARILRPIGHMLDLPAPSHAQRPRHLPPPSLRAKAKQSIFAPGRWCQTQPPPSAPSPSSASPTSAPT